MASISQLTFSTFTPLEIFIQCNNDSEVSLPNENNTHCFAFKVVIVPDGLIKLCIKIKWIQKRIRNR